MSKPEKLTKTLIDNWVEERQCQTLGLEKDNHNEDGTLCSKLHRQGHKGIFSTDTNVPIESCSTVKSSYVSPVKCDVRLTGKRAQLLTQYVYETAENELQAEIKASIEANKTPALSVTKQDFHKDFSPTHVQPCTQHSLSEQPVSFWSENLNQITGVSQVPREDLFFNKNASFSTPIEHQLHQQTL